MPRRRQPPDDPDKKPLAKTHSTEIADASTKVCRLCGGTALRGAPFKTVVTEEGAFGLLFACENKPAGCVGTVIMNPTEATNLNLVTAVGEAGNVMATYSEISADVGRQILATKSPRVKARLLSQWLRMARQQMQMGGLIQQRGAAAAGPQANVQVNILPNGPIDRFMKQREAGKTAVIDVEPEVKESPDVDPMAGLGG